MNGDSVDAATGRNTGHGNARKGDYLLRRASTHLQMIPTIHDFIGEAMNLHFAKKINAKGAQDAKGNQMSHWFSPKAPVQNPGNCDERHQRSGTEPYSAPEQGALLKGDDLHRRPIPSTPPPGGRPFVSRQAPMPDLPGGINVEADDRHVSTRARSILRRGRHELKSTPI